MPLSEMTRGDFLAGCLSAEIFFLLFPTSALFSISLWRKIFLPLKWNGLLPEERYPWSGHHRTAPISAKRKERLQGNRGYGCSRMRYISMQHRSIRKWSVWRTWQKSRAGVRSRTGKMFPVLDSRELCAADYGAPTTRKRWYAVIRNDHRAIRWPKPTNSKMDSFLLHKAASAVFFSYFPYQNLITLHIYFVWSILLDFSYNCS